MAWEAEAAQQGMSGSHPWPLPPSKARGSLHARMATEEHERTQMHVGQAGVEAEGQQRREQVLLSLPVTSHGQ